MANFKADEVIKALSDEGARIRSTQDAMIKAGLQAAPYRSKIRQAEIFEYAADLIARLTPYGDDVRAILSGPPGRAARALNRR